MNHTGELCINELGVEHNKLLEHYEESAKLESDKLNNKTSNKIKIEHSQSMLP